VYYSPRGADVVVNLAAHCVHAIRNRSIGSIPERCGSFCREYGPNLTIHQEHFVTSDSPYLQLIVSILVTKCVPPIPGADLARMRDDSLRRGVFKSVIQTTAIILAMIRRRHVVDLIP
jgi:hypothetical protein